MVAYETYANALITKGHGHPLWEPDPGDYPGVELGDVGFIDEGGFIRLFNASAGNDDPRNHLGLPQSHSPLPIGHIKRRTPLPKEPRYIASKGIQSTGADLSITAGAIGQAGGGVSFQCSRKQGGLLILGDPAYREDAVERIRYCKYIAEHHRSWLEFASQLGYDLSLSDLILVYGCDKTSEWACAAWSEQTQSVSLSFVAGIPGIAEGGARLWGEWISQQSLDQNVGPQPLVPSLEEEGNVALQRSSHSSNTTSTDQAPPITTTPRTLSVVPPRLSNQCVFVRGYQIGDRTTWFKRKRTRIDVGNGFKIVPKPFDSQRKATKDLVGGGRRFQEQGPSTSADSSQNDTSSATTRAMDVEYRCEDGDESSDSDDRSLTSIDEISTPVEVLIEYIFENSKAELALISHDDSKDYLEESSDPGAREYNTSIQQSAPVVYVRSGIGMFAGTYDLLQTQNRQEDGKQLDQRYSVFNEVGKQLNQRYSVFNEVGNQLDQRYSVFNEVGGNLTVYNTNGNSLEEEKILAVLNPAIVERRGYNVPGCMEGTRSGLFEEINGWLNDFGAPNVLWVSGSPGSGKSAVASSLVSELTRRRQLASHFFCKRDHDRLGDPAVLWRTVAYDLARFNPDVKASLLELLTKADFRDADILLHFYCLIVEPLTKNSEQSPEPPPVVVIDALDECGCEESQFEQRRILLDTIASWSSYLPLSCKLIITSRDERVPVSFHNDQLSRHIILETGDLVSRSTADDIRIFFEKSFAYITPELGLPSLWPGISRKMQLTERAAGLFIWAKTTIAFIAENQGNPDTKLQLILEGKLGKGRENIDSLYRQILHFAFRNASDATLELFKAVVGTITLAKVPLCRNDLKYFIGREDAEDDRQIGVILHKLSSVIGMGDDGLLHIRHLSFVEFLSDAERCDEFFVDLNQHRRNLALVCLGLMNRELRFNICGLETSHRRNDDMKKPIPIPAHLSYSCRFWAEHLVEDHDTHDRSTLLKEIREFLYNRFLFWLEVLSLNKEIPVAQRALLTAIHWLGASDKSLSAFAKDAHRFVVCFRIPISESAPHIYLSALPFSPRKSRVSKQFLPQFPHTLSVTNGRCDRWPAILNVLTGHTSHILSASFSPDGKHIVSGSADKTICIWDAETGLTISGPLKGHTDYVRSAVFSPDGKRVVSGSDDTTICIWDIETSRMVLGPLKGHLGFVRSVAFSPDGKHIISGSGDKTLRLWDAETGKIVASPFEGHTGFVMSVAFSLDGKNVVSGSHDRTIRIWDPMTGETISGPFRGHINDVRSVAFAPDGKSVVSCSADHTIRIWDVATGEIISGPFREHTDYIRSVAFSPDGKYVVSGCDDRTIRVWDVATGKTVLGPLEGHSDYIRSVAFSPDGQRIVSCADDKTIRIWEAKASMTVTGPVDSKIHYVRSVSFSPDGKSIVSASDDGHVRIWDTKTGDMVTDPLTRHTEYIRSVAFSPDGRRIVSGADDATIRIWDASTGRPILGPLTGHTGHVLSVAYSPDSKWVVSGSDDETIRFWDAETGLTMSSPLKGHVDYVRSVIFSPDGKYIVSASDDKTIRVWDTKTRQSAAGPFEGHTDYVTSIAFSPDGKYIVSGSDDETIRIWNFATGKPVSGPFKGHSSDVRSVAFSPDGKRIVSGSADFTIRIWDVATGRTILGPFKGHTDYVRSVAFSPDGKFVVSGSDDETVRIWDIASGKTVLGPLEGQTRYVRSVAFSPDGSFVVSGSDDKTIYIWDATTGSKISGPFLGHTGYVRSVAFSPDGKRVVSGSEDKTIRIWDVGTCLTVLGPLNGHDKFVRSVVFSRDGKRVASGSDDRTIRIWDIDTGEVVAGPFKGHTGYVTSVAFSPDGEYIASGSNDQTIRIWNSWTGKMVFGPYRGHSGHVSSCAFSPDGRRVVSGSADKTVRIWDVRTGKVSGPFEGHTGYVRSVAFSPTGALVVSGSDDKTIRVWDPTTGRTVSSPFEGHTNYVMSVAFSPDGRRLVSGSADKRIRVWAIEADQQVSGSSLSVNVTYSPTEKGAVVGLVRESLWNAGRSALPCGFLLDHSNGWATSQDSTIGSPAPLMFWVPPHHRRGICGSETISIMQTTLNELDFYQFMHGSSWTQCYTTPVPKMRRSLSPLPLNALPQGDTPVLLLRTFGLVLLLVLSCVGGGAMVLLARDWCNSSVLPWGD